MKTNTGFSLIEVLIAMIILAGGLLGLAGLQATSLRNNQSSYNRSVATQLAYEMADRMRANYTEANKSEGNLYSSIALDKATQKPSCLSISTDCKPADMAQHDLYEWNQVVQSSLPNGTGTIAKQGVSGVFTITINWTENRYETGENVSAVTSFQTSFQL